MNFVFFGTPDFATTILDELKTAGLVPTLIVTQPDKPVGRKQILTPPPVKVWADENEVETLQPVSLRDDSEIELLLNSEWDLFVVAAYGLIFPRDLIELPQHGTLVWHPSLLPKYRGASPIRSHILADDPECGVTIMQMDEKMDHGPIISQISIAFERDSGDWPQPAPLLEDLFAREGGKLLAETVPLWVKGKLPPTEQEHELATFTKKIEKADGEIKLTDDGYHNYLKYCAYHPWPGVFYFDENGKRVKITDAECVDGEFRPVRIIPEGKKETDYIG